jgi:hypothetical protein
LFSGRIKESVPEYKSGEEYTNDVDFFTIDNEESYNMVNPMLSNEVRFVMRAGPRIMGNAVMDKFHIRIVKG